MSACIDTGVVIALVNSNDAHHEWSNEAFARQKAMGPTIFSDIAFAEFSLAYSDHEEPKRVCDDLGLIRRPLSDRALRSAALANLVHRKATHPAVRSALPDFFIAAQALDLGIPLLTTDTRDFETLFPGIVVIRKQQL